MLCKLDENLPGSACAIFASHGHEAHTVLEEGLGGATDPEVMKACQIEKRVLFTLDSDFGDIRSYPPADHAGVVVLRPLKQDLETILAMIQRALQVLANQTVSGRLWIVEENRVRMRE